MSTKTKFGFGSWLRIENVLTPYNANSKTKTLIKYMKRNRAFINIYFSK